MNEEERCEHEFNLTEEYFMEENKVEVVIRCSICGREYKGTLEEK